MPEPVQRQARGGTASPRRPPTVSAGARAHQGGAAGLVRSAGVRRGRDERAAGLARQRDAPARLRHRADRPDGARRPLYLHTSPEFACKKLLAAGEERIFTFAPVFRNRERGALHHPAFTMLEWYRARRAIRPADGGLRRAAAARRRGRRQDAAFRSATLRPIVRRRSASTVAEAFARYAGIDLLATLPAAGPPSPRSFEQGRGEGQRQTPAPARAAAPHPNPSPLKMGRGERHARDRALAAASAPASQSADDDTWADIFSRSWSSRSSPTSATAVRRC